MSNLPQSYRIASIESAHVAELIRIGDDTGLSPWSAESYFAEMKNPAAIMMRLVSDENRTVGFTVGRLVPGGEIDLRTDAEIYNIAIIEGFRRRGLGQVLLDEFCERAAKRSARNIWLEVRESNSRAISFYEKNGFERVQTRPNFYSNPCEHATLMRLRLAPQKS